MTLQMMADLLEGEGWINRYEKHKNDLLMKKLRELFELMCIKKQDLLYALSSGKINREQFGKLNSQLRNFWIKSMEEIIELITILDNPTPEFEKEEPRKSM